MTTQVQVNAPSDSDITVIVSVHNEQGDTKEYYELKPEEKWTGHIWDGMILRVRERHADQESK